jgi:hypothetical protein
MRPSTTTSDAQQAFDAVEAMSHHLGHRDAVQPDTIDHYPGALQEAEQAAQRAHLKGLDAEQAQAASGTVNLLHRYGGSGKDNIVLVPAPTADPQGKSRGHELSRTRTLISGCAVRVDPFNLPVWRRIAVIVMLQICEPSSVKDALFFLTRALLSHSR